MFRSSRRPVVYTQAIHAQFAAAIAAAWGNERFAPPPLDLDAFVRGVALHDRGYGVLDTDGIGEVSRERWFQIQRRSFEPRRDDPVVDVVAALHVLRLVSKPHDPVEAAALPVMEAILPELYAAAGVGEAAARAADSITDLCDRVSFDVCLEDRSEWTRPVLPAVDAAPIDVAFSFDGVGLVTLAPWPLGIAQLRCVLVGYEADGYPDRLEPVVESILIRPA